jgi:serine/threonine-protein kinase SRPK3
MSDRSSTGKSGSIYYEDQEIIPDNGLKIETAPFGLEKLYDYEPGGHHPVHLHDVFNNRYRVIHKLGSGGFANVWLCRDLAAGLPKYVAAKVIAAEGSTAECPESRVAKLLETGCEREVTAIYFSLPLDQFEIHGPNGTHYVFVYPVLGPRVSKLLHLSRLDNPGPQLRKMCLEIAQAMATIHAHGICHGGMLFHLLPITWIAHADKGRLSRLSTSQYTSPNSRVRWPLGGNCSGDPW